MNTKPVRKGRWIRRILRLLAVFAICITGLVVYYKIVTVIPPPKVEDQSALSWKREQKDSTFFVVKNNWLRKSETGLWEVYLEGNAFERGAAYGNMAQELLLEQEIAFVGQLKKMVPDEGYIKFLKYFIAWFNRDLHKFIPLEYQQEIYGESFFGPESFHFIGKNYPRMLNYHAAHDIGHALYNANLVGCTSFAVKDEATVDHTLLIARNLDFNMGQDFAKNKVIAFIHPEQGYKHMMVTWPGFFGVVSGMNEKGLTVTLNAAPSGIPFYAKTPISLLAREILQYARNFEDAIRIAASRKTFVAELIMIGSAEDHGAMIIEKTPESMTFYRQEEKERLTCSNHFLSSEMKDSKKNTEQFEKTSTLYRYERINQLLDSMPIIDPAGAAAILRNRFGKNGAELGMGNENAINQLYAHHGIIFQPEERKVWVSCNPYQLGKFICYDLDEVFACAEEVKETGKEIYDKNATISEDAFLYTSAYRNFEKFLDIRLKIEQRLKQPAGEEFSAEALKIFCQLNPEFYLGYALAGDYLKMKKEYFAAKSYFEMALKKDIPLQIEREKIEKKLEWLEKH